MTAIVFDANVVGALAVALVETVGHLGGEGAEAGGGQFVDLAFVFGGSILGGHVIGIDHLQMK